MVSVFRILKMIHNIAIGVSSTENVEIKVVNDTGNYSKRGKKCKVRNV